MSDFDQELQAAAAKYGVDFKLARAVMMHESGGNIAAVGDGGNARGLFQMHEAAVKDCGGNVSDWLNLTINAASACDFGCNYLARMLKTFKGDVAWALMGWNQGVTVISRAKKYADAVQAIIASSAG